MSEADEAFEAAKTEILRSIAAGDDELYLNDTEFNKLERLPEEISEFERLRILTLDNTNITDLTLLAGSTKLQSVWLNNTNITDLAPLAGITGLRALWLKDTDLVELTPLTEVSGLVELLLHNTKILDLSPLARITGLQCLELDKTKVTDLTPLAAITGLQRLSLNQSDVSDLRPICELPFSSIAYDSLPLGLHFKNTPAARSCPELTRLSEIGDDETRTRETLAYLKTLPPWPEPLLLETKGGKPQAGGKRPSQVAQSQIAFLLDHAAVSSVNARITASQIRNALRDVPAQPGSNELPEILQMTLNMATILDKTAVGLDMQGSGREAALQSRLKELEAQVEALTQKLTDETTRAEAAKALANGKGVWASYKKSSGTMLGVVQFAVAGTGLVAGATYLLGSDHPMIRVLLETLKITK